MRSSSARGSLLGGRRVQDFLSRTVPCFAWTETRSTGPFDILNLILLSFLNARACRCEYGVDRGLREQHHRAVADRSVGGGRHGRGGEGGLVVDRGQRADAEVGMDGARISGRRARRRTAPPRDRWRARGSPASAAATAPTGG